MLRITRNRTNHEKELRMNEWGNWKMFSSLLSSANMLCVLLELSTRRYFFSFYCLRLSLRIYVFGISFSIARIYFNSPSEYSEGKNSKTLTNFFFFFDDVVRLRWKYQACKKCWRELISGSSRWTVVVVPSHYVDFGDLLIFWRFYGVFLATS